MQKDSLPNCAVVEIIFCGAVGSARTENTVKTRFLPSPPMTKSFSGFDLSIYAVVRATLMHQPSTLSRLLRTSKRHIDQKLLQLQPQRTEVVG